MTEKSSIPLFIERALELVNSRDSDRLESVLDRLCREDSPLAYSLDTESGQIILRSNSEERLEALIETLKVPFAIDVRVGTPQVAYRETLSKPVTIQYTHKKQTGGSGQFAEVKIEFEPLPPGSGFVFENDVVGGSIPKEFIPSVEKGLKAQKENGLLAGFPVIDFKATLVDSKHHEVDSNALTFDIAARACFRELASKGVVRLLEPIMKVEVVTPDDFLGGVIGDLNARRGHVRATETLGDVQVVTAIVSMSGMFGYTNTLRSMTQGRAKYSMQFDRYEKVPHFPEGDDDPRFPGAAALRVA
jgi:elongation factor G